MREPKAAISRPISLGSGVVTLELVVSAMKDGAETASKKLKYSVTVRSPVKLLNENMLEPSTSVAGGFRKVTWGGVHAMFILEQSPAVWLSKRPNGSAVFRSEGLKVRFSVTDVMDVVGLGLANEKLNKKSLEPAPVPLKQSATTKPTFCEPHEPNVIPVLGSP
jgi:hypothetical protein